MKLSQLPLYHVFSTGGSRKFYKTGGGIIMLGTKEPAVIKGGDIEVTTTSPLAVSKLLKRMTRFKQEEPA